jgi:hypothetical protein
MALDEFKPDDRESDDYYENEATVVRQLAKHFMEDGYEVKTQNTGIDIIAELDNRTLGIEMKCHYEADPGQKVYTALGQIIYRMNKEDIENPSTNGAIGFPRDVDGTDLYRKHIQEEVSRNILEMLSICTVLVDTEGYEIIEPGAIGSE